MFRDEPTQLEMPLRVVTKVDHTLIEKQADMTAAIRLSQTLSGLDDAQFYGEGRIVKHQAEWTRIVGPSKSHNFPHDKLLKFMDMTGNEVPLLWLAHRRGYDMGSLHLRETELERANRMLREENAALRRVLQGATV